MAGVTAAQWNYTGFGDTGIFEKSPEYNPKHSPPIPSHRDHFREISSSHFSSVFSIPEILFSIPGSRSSRTRSMLLFFTCCRQSRAGITFHSWVLPPPSVRPCPGAGWDRCARREYLYLRTFATLPWSNCAIPSRKPFPLIPPCLQSTPARPVHTPRGQPPAVRGERHRADPTLVARQDEGGRIGNRQVPHPHGPVPLPEASRLPSGENATEVTLSY